MSKIEATQTVVTPFRRNADGDRAAYLSLAEGQWQRLVSLARSVVGDADAEDAVQDSLLTAWRKLETLRNPEALGAWVTRIVIRTCLRKAKRGRLLTGNQLVPIEEVPEPVAPAQNQRPLDMERLLRTLAPRQRVVMHLTVVEEMSDGEISRALGITPGSVRSHRRRARRRLHKMLHGGEATLEKRHD